LIRLAKIRRPLMCKKHEGRLDDWKNQQRKLDDLADSHMVFHREPDHKAIIVSPYFRGSKSYRYWISERIRMSILALAACSYMLTLTYDPDKWGHCRVCAWDIFLAKWHTYVKVLRHIGIGKDYYMVLEPTKRYFPHAHIILTGRYVPPEVLKSLTKKWGARTKYERLRKHPKNYISKYVIKELKNRRFHALLSMLGANQWNTSRGLLLSLEQTKKRVRKREQERGYTYQLLGMISDEQKEAIPLGYNIVVLPQEIKMPEKGHFVCNSKGWRVWALPSRERSRTGPAGAIPPSSPVYGDGSSGSTAPRV